MFIALDLLYLNGKDMRTLPLIERKRALKKLLRRKRSRILYLDHMEGDGGLLFTGTPSRYRIKVKNSRYSQLEGREELFERM